MLTYIIIFIFIFINNFLFYIYIYIYPAHIPISTISDSSPSPKELIKPQRGVQRLYQTHKLNHRALSSFSLRGLSKLKKKRGELLYANCVSPFGFWETVGKIKETLVSFFFFLGFCIEFLIELLKKIDALLFFEIELVCGIGLCFWVVFDFWKDWISDRIFAYMLVFWGHLDRFRWL